MNIKKWIEENTSDLANKTIAITGSTGGLLNEAVKILASLNANLILINRNKNKTQQQIEQLKSLHPNISIDFVECDLSNFESVKIAIKTLKQKTIDILFLGAGIYNVPKVQTVTGFNNIFQTNFVSHYYLVKQLLPNLNKRNGKVVAVSSIAYNYSKIDENDIDFNNQTKPSKIYGNSKRFLTFSLIELMKNQNTTLSIVHPGVTLTEMTNHYPKAINWLVKIGIKLFFPTPKQATLSLIKGIFNSTYNLEWIGPKIFSVWGKPKKQKIKKISKLESEKIFNIAENIYKELNKK